MTVASLWKALDKAHSGKGVGAKQIAWSNEERLPSGSSRRTALAVDLSIWICESFTSRALKENHVNPHLHLVFARTIKLLSLGIKLIFVVEGKRRTLGDHGEEDKLYKRPRGTAFWKACKECQQMLELLGVPVVRAKAEGEALCALLNQKGVVDGVISNDGDCLLFGAKTVYTRFSLDHLENDKVIRYDSSSLRASADAITDGKTKSSETITLSRSDLITFAILTGSDMVGCGLEKVGSSKALRFIRKCQLDFPRSTQTAAIDELMSWSRAAGCSVHEDKKPEKACLCSRCCHTGTKRDHPKHGCVLCGTSPGEHCYEVSSDDRFRDLLREKALALQPPFDPTQAIRNYMRPNDNQLPMQLVNVTSETLEMQPPQLHALASLRIIIKGRSLEPSREYVIETVARLLSRRELFLGCVPRQLDRQRGSCREEPIPQQITKIFTRNQTPCYQVTWKVRSTVTDIDGEDLDGFEYTSVEQKALFDARFNGILSTLLAKYNETEKERTKQGHAEQCRRREFLDKIMGWREDGAEEWPLPSPKKAPSKSTRKRQAFFRSIRPDPHALADIHYQKLGEKLNEHVGQDVLHLLGMPPTLGQRKKQKHLMNHQESKIIDSRSRNVQDLVDKIVTINEANGISPLTRCTVWDAVASSSPGEPTEAPSPLFCRLGGCDIAITPLVSRRSI